MIDPPDTTRRSRRRRLSGLAALSAVLCLPVACAEETPAATGPGGSFRIPVTWSLIEPGEVAEQVELVGDVVSRRWARLAFERPGRVVEVLADLGDEVAGEQLLARLDDKLLEQDLAVARAVLEATRVDADFAAREAERADSAGEDVLSESERDRRRAEALSSAARLAQRQAEVARLTELLDQGRLRAPFDGVISARNITLGSYATVGQPAFTLVDMVHREVRLEIPISVATGLERGTEVALRVDELPDFELLAALDELVPAADLSTRLFIGVVRLDGLDEAVRLRPGMFARARFTRARAESQTVVPSDSVLHDERGAYIVVMDPPENPGSSSEEGPPAAPTARIVPVRVLAADSQRTAVLAIEPGTLQPGGHVVVTGADNVFPGAPLAPTPPLEPHDGARGDAVGGSTSGAEASSG
jgi:RND family efflux transporter MFP subunit